MYNLINPNDLSKYLEAAKEDPRRIRFFHQNIVPYTLGFLETDSLENRNFKKDPTPFSSTPNYFNSSTSMRSSATHKPLYIPGYNDYRPILKVSISEINSLIEKKAEKQRRSEMTNEFKKKSGQPDVVASVEEEKFSVDLSDIQKKRFEFHVNQVRKQLRFQSECMKIKTVSDILRKQPGNPHKIAEVVIPKLCIKLLGHTPRPPPSIAKENDEQKKISEKTKKSGKAPKAPNSKSKSNVKNHLKPKFIERTLTGVKRERPKGGTQIQLPPQKILRRAFPLCSVFIRPLSEKDAEETPGFADIKFAESLPSRLTLFVIYDLWVVLKHFSRRFSKFHPIFSILEISGNKSIWAQEVEFIASLKKMVKLPGKPNDSSFSTHYEYKFQLRNTQFRKKYQILISLRNGHQLYKSQVFSAVKRKSKLEEKFWQSNLKKVILE